MKLIDHSEIRKLLVDDEPIVLNQYKYLYSDLYTMYMSEHIQNQFDKRCSSKVQSHILMTQMIYLMERFAVFVDVENEKLFFNSSSKEYYIEYKNQVRLYHCLYSFFDNLIDEYWDDYETYRNHTRRILDNLDEYDDQPNSKIWHDLVSLSEKYFLENKR